MQFQNFSKRTIRVPGSVFAETINKAPGVTHIMGPKYVIQSEEHINEQTGLSTVSIHRPTRISQKLEALEIAPGAVFDVPEKYARPRRKIVDGSRLPGVFEELVGCPGDAISCPDTGPECPYWKTVVEVNAMGQREVRRHVIHPVCLPADEAERAHWLEPPTDGSRTAQGIAQLEAAEQVARENAALKDTVASQEARMAKLEAMVAALTQQDAPPTANKAASKNS